MGVCEVTLLRPSGEILRRSRPPQEALHRCLAFFPEPVGGRASTQQTFVSRLATHLEVARLHRNCWMGCCYIVRKVPFSVRWSVGPASAAAAVKVVHNTQGTYDRQ